MHKDMRRKMFTIPLFTIAKTSDYSKFLLRRNRVNRECNIIYVLVFIHGFQAYHSLPKVVTETLIFSCFSVSWLARNKFCDPSCLTIIRCSSFQMAPAPNPGGRNIAQRPRMRKPIGLIGFPI